MWRLFRHQARPEPARLCTQLVGQYLANGSDGMIQFVVDHPVAIAVGKLQFLVDFTQTFFDGGFGVCATRPQTLFADGE